MEGGVPLDEITSLEHSGIIDESHEGAQMDQAVSCAALFSHAPL